MSIKSKVYLILLVLITLLSLGLRLYKLGEVPPSISWDEAAVGYNAWTIVTSGQDEWGRTWPLTFKSFEDDKRPVHIYLTSISVLFLGLNEFSLRLPMALMGGLSVFLIYFLAQLMFKNEPLSLSTAFLLAITPYHFQFSRFNHEAVVCLFFFILALTMFYLFVKKDKKYLLPISIISFGLSLLSYYTALVVIPPLLLLIVILYRRQIFVINPWSFLSLATFVLILLLFYFNTGLIFSNRISQVTISENEIKSTTFYKNSGNLLLGRAEVTYQRYIKHLSPQFLFINGDQNPKFSIQSFGQFLPIQSIFLVVGLAQLIYFKSKESTLVLIWVVLSPLTPSLAGGEGEVPHSARALFMMGSFSLLAGAGFSGLLNIAKSTNIKIVFALMIFTMIGYSFINYLSNYFTVYPRDYAYAWQFGMKEIGSYLKKHKDEYSQVYITDVRDQPYIFLLYYLQPPLEEYLESRYLNQTKHRSSNLVTFFDKYNFGEWNRIESSPQKGVLYVVSPSEFDGLRYKPLFDIKEVVYYPNNTVAYYLVSGK